MSTLTFNDLVSTLQVAQKSWCLSYLCFFLNLSRISAGIFQSLNLLKSGRMLTVIDDIVLADDAQLSGCMCFTDAVVCAASVYTNVVNGYVFDGQCHVTEVEECRDP